MNFKDLIKEAENPKYIEGIYNYCDRWCERCIFTAQCLNFSISESHEEIDDVTNEKFWENLTSLLEDAISFLSEKISKDGIDFDEIEIDIYNADDADNEIDNYESVKIAEDYTKQVARWIKENSGFIESFESKLNNPEKFDPIAVINWYHTQIYVKLKRAYLSRTLEHDDEEDDYPKDSEGSAKVALIGLDRSLASWGELIHYNDLDENRIINFLLVLEKLKRLIEKDFPYARNFIRPGFDLLN